MKEQLNIAVIGRGPLGLSLAMLLKEANCKVTNYYGIGNEIQSAAISNLATAVSGMRFFQSGLSPGTLRGLVEVFEDAKIGFQQRLDFQPQHQGRVLDNGDMVQHGIFAFSKDRLQVFKRKLASKNMQEFANQFGDFSSVHANALLDCLEIQDRVFTTSPEIPFSQEQHLRVLEHRCQGIKEIAVKAPRDLSLVPDPTRKSQVQIVSDGVPAEDDYDLIFIATGRYLPHLLTQLKLNDQVQYKVWKFHNARFPDDPAFGASVYYDFESHLSVVRHKVHAEEGHCLLVNLGDDFESVSEADLNNGKPLPSIPTDQERTTYLEKVRRYYPFQVRDPENNIGVMSCYLIDISRQTNPENAFRPSSQPFIFSDKEQYPKIIFGSCFRSVLSLDTAEKMILKSGAKITEGRGKSPQMTLPTKKESHRPPHIVEKL